MPKITFGYTFVGLGMENVGICYFHLEYSTLLWEIFYPFKTIFGYLEYLHILYTCIFPHFGKSVLRKIRQAWH
jgi:hypothetical protein